MFALVLLAFSAPEIITIIGVATTSLISIIAAIASVRNGNQIVEVRREVTTMNGQTLAMLADSAETRRVAAIPEHRRTEREEEHIVSVTYQGADPVGRDAAPEGVDNPPKPEKDEFYPEPRVSPTVTP